MFKAKPAADLVFRSWQGVLSGQYSAERSVPMDGNKTVIVEFVHRPEMQSLSLRTDLAAFISDMDLDATVSALDQNKTVYEHVLERTYLPKGIPDEAELYLLESVLRTPTLDLSSRSGVASGPV